MNCPSCLEPRPPVHIEKWGPYRLVRCVECDLTYASPMKSSADYYRQAAGWEVPPTWRWEFTRFFEDRLPPRGRMLDLGCGFGFFAAEAQNRGYHVTGIDPSPEAVEFARTKNGGRRIHRGSFESLPRKGMKLFDIITCFHVLEHVESPRGLLTTLRSRLLTGGHLILGVPNPNRWLLRLGRDFGDYPPIHLSRWNRRSLEYALGQAGFRLVVLEEEVLRIDSTTMAREIVRATLNQLTSTGYIARSRRDESLSRRDNKMPADVRPRRKRALAALKEPAISLLSGLVAPSASLALRGRCLRGPGLYVRAEAI